MEESAALKVNEMKTVSVSQVMESDNEALSSLLMLANSNPRKDDGIPSLPHANERMAVPTSLNSQHSNSVSARPLTTSGPSHPSIAFRPPPIHPLIPAAQPAATASNKEITLNDLRKYFHLPINEVANRLGTCTTALKKVCRRLKISKWPYRQILSITKSIQSLEMATMADHVDEKQREQYHQQIYLLRRMLSEVIKHPNKTIDDCQPPACDTTDITAEEGRKVEAEEGAARVGADVTGSPNNSSTVSAANKTQTHPHYKHINKHSHLDNNIEDPTEEVVQQLIKAAADNMNASLTFIGRCSNSSSHNNNNPRKRKTAADSDDSGNEDKPGQVKKKIDTLNTLRHRDMQAHEALQSEIQLLDQRLNHTIATAASSSSQQPQAAVSASTTSSAHANTTSSGTAANTVTNTVTSTIGRWAELELGQTKLKFLHNPDNDSYTFLGPIQLAPLQRRKFKVTNPAQQRRIVPLMEPDVGGNASVEFVSQTIVNALRKKMDDHNLMLMANALQLPPLPASEGQGQGQQLVQEQRHLAGLGGQGRK